MQAKSVGIVICNYNKSAYVIQCIQSVLESKFTDYALYVVDNASTDDSVELIQKNYAGQLTLLQNEENLGGSGGFNRGLREALKNGHSYLVCLDNDVIVDENAIGELKKFLDTHEETGMVGSKVYHMELPGIIQQYGMTIDFENYATQAKYYNEPDHEGIPDVVYSDAVAACSLMVRREVVEKIGLMPEENFLYWDDTEWGWRCNLAGYRVASCGSSVVLHAMGAKKEVVNTFPTYYAWRNWIWFFLKYTPQEKLEQMSRSFLSSLFEIYYEGWYKNETSRMKTVRIAYQDAMNARLGKAGEDAIFPVDRREERLKALIHGKKKIFIEVNGYEITAQEIKKQIQQLSPETEVVLRYCRDYDLTFMLCSSIFHLDGYSRRDIYVDMNGCILETPEEFDRIEACPRELEKFLFVEQPYFIRQAKMIQKKHFAQ